jgi:hypothetical protein
MVELIGRCYLQYGSRLQQQLLSKGILLSATAPPTTSVVNNNRPAREAFSAQEWTQLAEHGLAGRSQSLLLTSSDIILIWLLLSDEISMIGYDAQLMAQLSQLVSEVNMAEQAAQLLSSSIRGAEVIALSKKLQAAGAALGGLAVKTICNNPGCTNASMQHEWQLVSEGRCSKCKAAAYCSRDCQAAHWKCHKPVCKGIAAATAAAAAAAAEPGSSTATASAELPCCRKRSLCQPCFGWARVISIAVQLQCSLRHCFEGSWC